MAKRVINDLSELSRIPILRDDWDNLCSRYILTEAFMEKHFENLSMWQVSRFQPLSVSFLRKHKADIQWRAFFSHQKHSEEDLEAYIREGFVDKKVCWRDICTYQVLSEGFIRRHIGDENIDGKALLRKQNLSESFIEEFADKLGGWRYISARGKLSEDFIRRNAKRVAWLYICRFQKLSEPFIEEFDAFVKWAEISGMQKLSEAFIERNAEKLDWKIMSSAQKFSEAFMEKHKDKLNWAYLSAFQKLSDAFMRRHIQDLDLSRLVLSQKLTEDFMIDFSSRFTRNDWHWISRKQVFSFAFANRFANNLSAYYLARRDDLPFVVLNHPENRIYG